MAKLKSLRLQTYDFVLDRIREGYYLAGEKISEEELAEELGVSRTPIKEALLLLTANGILDNQSRRGFFVRSMDAASIIDNNDIIGHLDAFVAELTIDLLNENDYQKMQECVDAIDTAIETKNLADYDTNQVAFHNVYYHKCPNSQLLELINSLHNKYLDTMALATDIEGAIQTCIICNNNHREIIELFKSKDRHKLCDLIIEHWRTPYIKHLSLPAND